MSTSPPDGLNPLLAPAAKADPRWVGSIRPRLRIHNPNHRLTAYLAAAGLNGSPWAAWSAVMSFREFVLSVETSARAAGINVPMAKLRDAIAIACHNRTYSACLAAEEAGSLPALTLPPRHLEAAALQYRIPEISFLQAFRDTPPPSRPAARPLLIPGRFQGLQESPVSGSPRSCNLSATNSLPHLIATVLTGWTLFSMRWNH